jgi:hypothetical protein
MKISRLPQLLPACFRPSAQAGKTEPSAPKDEPRALSGAEQKWIEDAVQKAFDALPAKLVKEMANMPEVTDELVRLSSPQELKSEQEHRQLAAQLKADRSTAVGMIALHTVMKHIVAVRNKRWVGAELDRMSGQIDACAEAAIKHKLAQLSGQGAGMKKLMAQTVKEAGKPRPHYAVGLSAREEFALQSMSEVLMRRCLPQKGTPYTPAERRNFLAQRPVEEIRAAYLAFNQHMGAAFGEVFDAFDKRVRGDSLVAVDQRKLRKLASALQAQEWVPGSWLDGQQQRLAKALDNAAKGLPEESRDAWKEAYIAQFLGGHEQGHWPYPLTPLSDADSDAWYNACLEQEKNGHQLGAALQRSCESLPPHLRKEWKEKYLDIHHQCGNLNGIAASAAALWHIREKRMNEAARMPQKKVDPNQAQQWLQQAIETLDKSMGELEPEAKVRRDVPTRFSDLREAYDEPDHSAAPWKDTRNQEAIATIAGKTMLKSLRPEHRAGTLEALAAYGPSAVKWLRRGKLRIVSCPPEKCVVTTEQRDKSYEKSQAQERKSPTAFSSDFRFTNKSFDVGAYYASSYKALEKHRIILGADSTSDSYCVVTHELGHAVDSALTGKNRYSRTEAFSDKHKGLRQEHEDARKNASGITRYAETDRHEFFAESAVSFLGLEKRGYTTNRKLPGRSPYNADNLRVQHPATYNLLDTMFRSDFDMKRFKRALKHAHGMSPSKAPHNDERKTGGDTLPAIETIMESNWGKDILDRFGGTGGP